MSETHSSEEDLLDLSDSDLEAFDLVDDVEDEDAQREIFPEVPVDEIQEDNVEDGEAASDEDEPPLLEPENVPTVRPSRSRAPPQRYSPEPGPTRGRYQFRIGGLQLGPSAPRRGRTTRASAPAQKRPLKTRRGGKRRSRLVFPSASPPPPRRRRAQGPDSPSPGPAGPDSPGPAGPDSPGPAGPDSPGPAGPDSPGPAGPYSPGPAGPSRSPPPGPSPTSPSEPDPADSGDVYHGNDGTVWTTAIPNQQVRTGSENVVSMIDGRVVGIPDDASLLDIFLLLLSEDMLHDILWYSNRYAAGLVDQENRRLRQEEAELLAAGENPPPLRQHVWLPVTRDELLGFIGILVWAGYDRSKKYPVQLMWANDRTFARAVPKATLSRDRFQVIMRVLRFDHVEARHEMARRGGPVILPKSAPVQGMVRQFDQNLRQFYEPGCLLTVDEMLVKFRGRAPFRVYMKSKPGRYGLKVWTVVDTKTSYVVGYQIYEGKPAGGQPERNQGARVVMDLVRPYFGSGRSVTTDNFFTSLHLARALKVQNMTLLGTMRKIRKEVPRPLCVKRGREPLTSIFVFNHEQNCSVTLCSYKPEERKEVVLVPSSEHHDDNIPALNNPKLKPEIILDYNSRKGGVDSADQLIAEYSCERPTRRWPMKIFFSIINVAAMNAYKLFLMKNPNWSVSRNPKVPGQPQPTRYRRLRAYHELALQLAWPMISHRYATLRNLPVNIRSAMDDVAAAIGRPLPVRHFPPIGGQPEEGVERPQRRYPNPGRCVLCPAEAVRNRRSTRTRCSLCTQFVCAQHNTERRYCDECVESRGRNIIDTL